MKFLSCVRQAVLHPASGRRFSALCQVQVFGRQFCVLCQVKDSLLVSGTVLYAGILCSLSYRRFSILCQLRDSLCQVEDSLLFVSLVRDSLLYVRQENLCLVSGTILSVSERKFCCLCQVGYSLCQALCHIILCCTLYIIRDSLLCVGLEILCGRLEILCSVSDR